MKKSNIAVEKPLVRLQIKDELLILLRLIALSYQMRRDNLKLIY